MLGMNRAVDRAAKLSVFVIDVLRCDIESMQTLISHLNGPVIGWRSSWHHDLAEEEIFPVLEELVHKDLVEVFQFSEMTG